MEIQSAFNASLTGIQRASDGITQTSRNIAQDSLSSSGNPAEQAALQQQEQQQAQTPANQQVALQSERPSTTDNLVNLVEDRNASAANVRALEVSNEVLGSIIDISV